MDRYSSTLMIGLYANCKKVLWSHMGSEYDILFSVLMCIEKQVPNFYLLWYHKMFKRKWKKNKKYIIQVMYRCTSYQSYVEIMINIKGVQCLPNIIAPVSRWVITAEM